MDFKKEFGALLDSAITDTGIELIGDLDAIKRYALERVTHLALIINEPGFEEAVVAETQNVGMFAGISIVNTADAADLRLMGILQGALRIGAAALA